jgi:hypothetical protein
VVNAVDAHAVPWPVGSGAKYCEVILFFSIPESVKANIEKENPERLLVEIDSNVK